MLIDWYRHKILRSGEFDPYEDVPTYADASQLSDKETVIIDGTSVKEYVCQRMDIESHPIEMCLNRFVFDARAPSYLTWVEYSHYSRDHKMNVKCGSIIKFGLFDEKIIENCNPSPGFHDKLIEMNPHWMMLFEFCQGSGERDVYLYPAAQWIFLDVRGEVLCPMGSVGFTITADPWYGTDEGRALLMGSLFIPLCTLSMLNVKNIIKREHAPADKVQRKRAKSGKLPLVKFHTLEVDAPGKRYHKSSAASDRYSESKNLPLHLVRGHIADYTSGKGLFGKYKGVFYIPAHMRGDIDNGVIKKRYETTSGESSETLQSSAHGR